MTRIDFTWADQGISAHDIHHAEAAQANTAVVDEARAVLAATLKGESGFERLLLRAAAGAGKSYALVDMVEHALAAGADRVAVTAFQNRQVQPLAVNLAKKLSRDAVVLLASKSATVPDDVLAAVNVIRSTKDLKGEHRVLLGTAHRLGAPGEPGRLRNKFGAEPGDPAFDVLFIDEAWQMSEHLFGKVRELGRAIVGVGDVGQLPPLDPSQNPWRGDPGYNPFRAWPSAFEGDGATWARDLPTVWRPTAAQLALWRAFYPEWDELHSVAAPGDRKLVAAEMGELAASFWEQVGSGRPTLVEISDLPEPDQPDVDLPLLGVAEHMLDALFESGFELRQERYTPSGVPTGPVATSPASAGDDPLIAVLATRNQMVDDARAMVDRLITKHGLAENVIVASTVDKYQGQTNGLTVAIHPLSGADRLDEFNSAFGRLAVVCTRATHGLVLLSRDGLDLLLEEAAARPGTPFNEPGPRSLPRQTHTRIVEVLDRGRIGAGALGLAE